MAYIYAIITLNYFSVASVNGSDVLTVIDVNPSQGEMVQSSTIDIPSGYAFGISMYCNNDEVTKVSEQGIRLNFPQRSFTFIMGPWNSYNYTVTNPFPNTELVVGQGSLGSVLYGPATVSVFAKSTPIRVNIYIQPVYKEIYFLDGELDQRQIDVPSNSILTFEASESGILPCRVTATTPQGVNILNSPRGIWKPFVNRNGINFTNLDRDHIFSLGFARMSSGIPLANPSTVINDWFYFPTAAVSYGTGNEQSIAGPAKVKFSTMTHQYSKTYYGVFHYKIHAANIRYHDSGNSTGNSTGNGTTATTFNLQLQRSTNLVDWNVVDNYYISETSDRAFYRLKPVPQ